MLATRERRIRRSDDLALALQYLLSAQRTRAGLTHILLASSDGFLLAWDGDITECEELAAYAPFIARGEGYALDPRRLVGVTVHTIPVGSQMVYLLLRGDPAPERVADALVASVEGVVRILRGR